MTHTVDLKTPISYAHKGEMVEGSFVELSAPNFKQIEHFLPVKQAFISAVTSISSDSVKSDKDQSDEIKVTGSQVLALMMQSSTDMTKVYLHCVELFKSGAAMIDGEQKLTQPLIDAMPLDDFDNLVGEYIANFIAASLMDGV